MAQKFTITAQLNLKAGNIGQVVKQLQSQFQGANVNFNIQQMTAAQAQLKKVGTSAQSASKSVNGLAKNISDAAKRFSALTIATGTFVGLARAIKNAVGDAIEFQREVVKIAQATGQSTSSLKGLEQEITRVSTTLGVSSKELLVAARNLTQAGFAANKVKGALDLLAKTELAATFDSISDTTEGVIAILNQFGRAAQKNGTEIQFLEKSLSAINQVSKDFAVESSDLITAVRTTGSAFESAGGSLDELLALFTSVRATTRESAESISTGFRTIFTRTQRVDTINNLKKLGIELQDAEGKFVGPIEATRRLSTALNSIDPRDFRFNVIVEELGGFRQVSKVIPLIQQFGVATKALSIAQKSSGSLSKDAVTAQEALAVQIAKVREEFLAFIRDLTGSSTFQSTIKGLLDLSSAFIKVAESVKPLLPLIGTFGAMKLGLNFLPSINQSLTRRKAAGGKIYGFAGGGMVPGTGNGDTVPAMLSPGEFVIRKSSVKKLGVDKLAGMNKYGRGGAVQYYEGAGGVKQDDKSKQKDNQSSSGLIESELSGIAAKTWIKDKNQISSNSKSPKLVFGPAQDSFNLTSFNKEFLKTTATKSSNGKFQFKIGDKKVNKKIAKDLLSNNANSATIFEEYIARNYGGKHITASGYPVDVIGGDRLRDGKFTPSGSYNEKSGRSKALSYYLSKQFGKKYSYSGKNSNTIILSSPHLLNKILTPENNKLESQEGFSYVFPSFEIDQDALAYLGIESPTGIHGKKEALNKVVPPNYQEPKEYFLGGLIQKFALGGPAGKSRGARAITIPRTGTYTFNKPAGADLDSKSAHDQIYKLNAEDRLDYDIDRHDVDVNNLKVSQKLLDEYHKADAQKRGYRFEDILLESGLASSLSKISNARLDGITKEGNPFEAKSTLSALGVNDLEDKLYGAIADSISAPEKLARSRFNANALTDGEDHIKVGKVTVFQDVTGGLGVAKQSRGRMGYKEEAAAKAAKEAGVKSSINAQDRLRNIVDKYFNSGFKIMGTQYSPIGPKGVHRDVAALLNKKLGGPYQDKIGDMTDQQVISLLNDIIVRKAMGGPSGTDTVPAMLTPGEFVINRKSAQAIGYGALNRMNQVGKFANGGIVPQRMGFGGIKTAAQAGTKITASMQSQNVTFASTKGAAALDKILQQIEKDGGNLSAAFKVLNSEITKNKNGQLKVTKELKSNLQEAGKQEPKDISNKLLLLSTAVGSVTTQFTSLGDAIQNGITGFITTFGILKVLVDGVGDTFKEMSEGKLGKFGNNIKQASLSVAFIQAAAQSYIAYSEANIKKSTDLINKETDKALQGQGNRAEVEKQSKAIGKEYQSNSYVSYAKNVTSGYGLGGAVVGGVLGSFLGPVGSAVGAAAGTAIGGAIDRYLHPSMKDAEKYFTDMNLAIYDANKELYHLSKTAEKYSQMGFAKVQAESIKAADSLAALQQRLDIQKAASAKNPNDQLLKDQVAASEEQIKKFNEILIRASGELNVKIAKDIASLTRVGGTIDVKAVTKQLTEPYRRAAKPTIDSLKKNLEEKQKTGNKDEIDKASKALIEAQNGLKESEIEQEQILNRTIAQTARQEAALKTEQEARDKLIGSIVQEKAVRDSISKFQIKVDSLNNSFAALQSVFEEGLDLKSFGNFDTISKSIGIEKPTKEFEQGLNILSSAFGQQGAELGNNLKSLQNASGGLDTALIELNKGLGANINYEQFFTEYFKRQGINVSQAVIEQISNVTRTTVGGEDKERGVVPGSLTDEARKQVVSLFEDIRKTSVDQAQTIISSFSTYENELNQRLSKFAQTVQNLSNYQLETADRFKKFNDIMGQATGRRITLQEKEYYRQQKQSLLGGSNAKDLGNKLLALQSKQVQMNMQRQGRPLTNRNEIEQYGRSVLDLKLQTDQTVKALQSLADQSEKTGDILSEIERIRGQREAVQGLTRQFAFGGDEERKSIATSIQALNTALMANNLDAIPEELRSSVGQLLDQFKDVPIFGGLTGENISKKFQFQELIKSGVAPQFAQSIFGQSTPEQQLIAELQKTFAQEEEARAALANREFQQQDLLISNIAQLNNNFDVMIRDILGARAVAQGQTQAARGALANQGIRGASDQNANAFLIRAQNAERAAAANQAELDRLRTQRRAKGGLIYRAGGGSIFQPQGTDTVPAMLTPGEYVIRKDAVDSIGVDTLNQINGYAMGGIVGATRQRFGQQMAARNNMFYNQMMAGPDVADQLETMSSYYNMTRLSPKQRREMSGDEQQSQAATPVPERRRGIDVRHIDRKAEREFTERKIEYDALINRANMRNRAYEASISYNQSMMNPAGSAKNGRSFNAPIRKATKNKSNAPLVYNPTTYEDNKSWWSRNFGNAGTFRRGEAPEQGGILEGLRSFNQGIGESTTGLASMGAKAVDFLGRQVGVDTDLSGYMQGFNRRAFGTGAKSDIGYYGGQLTGSFLQGRAAAMRGVGATKAVGQARGIAGGTVGRLGQASRFAMNNRTTRFLGDNRLVRGAKNLFTRSPKSNPQAATIAGGNNINFANATGSNASEAARSLIGNSANYKVPPNDVIRKMSVAEYAQLQGQSAMRASSPYAKGGLVGGTRLKRFAEGGPVGGEGLGGDMSGGFNVEALMGVANTFAAFTESMSKISETLNGLTMQHQVTIDGQLNLNGINSVEIAEVIKNQVGTFIANEVSRVMQSERMKP